MFLYYTLSILAIILYLYGFFPFAKNQHSEVIDPPEYLKDYKFNLTQVYKSDIDRTVIIVIDALRYDFMSPDNTPFITAEAANSGCSTVVKVESPTVTLPRIRALTTGSVPQFIDIVLNLMSTKTFEDSILHRAIEKHKKILFYGDETWLNVYPNVFMRSEGTSSFFVNDFTEVDSNVTRNVYRELLNDDWDIMILHYLGLDHIGHVHGPFSSLIHPKLREMDDVVRKIHQSFATESKKYLILITGDHGMKDSGGHGGNTHSETTVPLILLGTTCTNDSIQQTDIPATLSVLLGLSFPANNVGKVSSNILSSLEPNKLLYALRYNVLALQSKVNIYGAMIKNATTLHYEFAKQKNMSLFNDIKNIYEFCASGMSSNLISNAVEQNDCALIVSCSTILHCFLAILFENISKNRHFSSYNKIFISVTLLITFMNCNFITLIFVSSMLMFSTYYLCMLTKSLVDIKINCDTLILTMGCILHSLSLLSSSFIEEEHQVLYFVFGTLLLINVGHFKKLTFHQVLVFVIFRFVKKLNQTGDKWAFLPDLAQWFSSTENYVYLNMFFICCLILICVTCHQFLEVTSSKLLCPILVLIYILKMFCVDNCTFVWFIWCIIFINAIICSKKSLIDAFTISWILIVTVLLRPYNVILLPYCVYASYVLFQQSKNTAFLTIAHLWLGNVLFFCQGHSNSLASIDIASGYIGLGHYEPIVVLSQVICHTYAMPVLSLLLLLRRIDDYNIWKISIVYRLLMLLSIFFVTFIQKHHLFVWSVFAPKVLIESSHSLILFIEIMVCCIFRKSKLFLSKYDVFKI